MKREIEEGGGGAAMSPSLPRLPSAATASSSARVLGGVMKGPSSFHSLRAPSPIVRAMRTRIDPSPPLPVAPPPPRPRPRPPPPLLSQAPMKRRGRPRNCDRLMPPPGFLLSPPARATPALAAHVQCQSSGLQPHVLKIDVGEDIVSRIVQVSPISGRAVCVLSVLGSVQEAKLLQSSRAVLNHKGPLEIICMFGSILTPESPEFGCFSVTLACADCSVVGGIVAGPLIAATTVQAIVGTFPNDVSLTKRTPKIVAHYPNSKVVIGYEVPCSSNSQVPTGNGIRHHPSSQVTTGTESTQYSGSQVDIASGSTDYPSSHVPICKGSMLYSNSQVVTGNGSTGYPSSHVPIGNGSTQYSNPQAVIGNRSIDYPNPHVPFGYGRTDYPNHVPIGDGSTHHSNSQITVGNGSRHHPSSLVTVGTGTTHHPNSQVAIGNGNTHQADSHIIFGDGSASNYDCLGTVDNGGTCIPKVTVADGRTNNSNFATEVGDGSAYGPDSSVTAGNWRAPSVEVTVERVNVEDENTNYPDLKVSVDDGSSHYPNNKASVCKGSTPSIRGSTSCIVVEQDGSSEIDVKASNLVS